MTHLVKSEVTYCFFCYFQSIVSCFILRSYYSPWHNLTHTGSCSRLSVQALSVLTAATEYFMDHFYKFRRQVKHSIGVKLTLLMLVGKMSLS